MSSTTPHVTPTSPSSNFQSIFSTALKAYEKQTKKDLLAHPLASQLQTCNSPTSILAVLQGQVNDIDQARKNDERLTKWLGPIINVLLAFSDALGEGVSLVFSPAKVIFAGTGVLLQAAKDVIAAQDALIDIFERIENFFKRLERYTEVLPSSAMTDIIVKIMVEVLNILGIATKEIKQGRTKKYLKKLLGKTDIEDALVRLDKLTQEEVRMATAQLLTLTHGVDNKVTRIDVGVQDVDDKVKDIGDTVKVVHDDGKETKVIVKETARETTAIMQMMKNTATESERNQWRQDLQTWFSSPDPSINHIVLCGAQHHGTAEWFFQGSLLEEWHSNGSLLWIYGKPGSGKSVLCSAVIQSIMTLHDARMATVTYFYFDFRDTDKQNRRNLLLSLLSQLSACSDHSCDILHRVYMAHNKGARKPTDDALIQSLKEALTFSNDHQIYIIIDAIDECPNTFGMPSPRELVLDLVKELVELSLPNLHVFVSSRPEIDIRTVLEPLTSLRVSLHDETGQKKDIVEYIYSVVHSDAKMGKWREQDRNLVIEMLSERADGMFRWVFCQLETLRHCFPQSLRRILQELPESLDETYEQILKNINKATRVYAHRLLQCLTVATRPLRLEELAEVLAFDFDKAPGRIPELNADWRREDQEHAVLSTCSSLVTVIHDDGERVVQFSHFSVKEFLTSDRLAAAVADISFHHIALEPAHRILAQACLGVLLLLDDYSTQEDLVQRFPLVSYSAQYWVDHALFEDVSLHIKDALENLFISPQPHISRWIQISDMEDGDWMEADVFKRVEEAIPMYYAALFGFHDIVEKLIGDHPEHMGVWGGPYGTALHAAATNNHVKVVQSLLNHGADVNSLDPQRATPLHLASQFGRLEAGRFLLEHGADVTVEDEDSWTPLHVAVSSGQFELVRVLLKHNADIIDIQNSSGRTPLFFATMFGRVTLVRFLLNSGADPNRSGKDRYTPLHEASHMGDLEVAHLLLEFGADVNAEDDEGRTAHQIALKEGYDGIAQSLSGHGVEKT